MTTNKALISRSVIDRIIRRNAIAGRAAWIQNDRPKALAAAMLRDAVEITSAWVDRRLTEEIDTLASAALSKRITAYCCEDAA